LFVDKKSYYPYKIHKKIKDYREWERKRLNHKEKRRREKIRRREYLDLLLCSTANLIIYSYKIKIISFPFTVYLDLLKVLMVLQIGVFCFFI